MNDGERIDNFLLKCGTCVYKIRGRCKKITADEFGEIVDDYCSCDLYIPKRNIGAKLFYEEF